MWRILVAICALVGLARASESAAIRPEWRIPSTESIVVRSPADQREFQIMVAMPRGYAESGARYPVWYVLDANGTFPIAVFAANHTKLNAQVYLMVGSLDRKHAPLVTELNRLLNVPLPFFVLPAGKNSLRQQMGLC